MLMIPFEIGNGQYNVFVILESENVARMRENDPAQVNLWKMPEPYSKLALRDVILSSPSAEDTAKAIAMIQGGNPKGALEFLSRGFQYKPRDGDNDFPYTAAGRPA